MALGGLARRMAALRASRLRARPGKISTPQSGRIIFLIGGAAFVAARVLAATGALGW